MRIQRWAGALLVAAGVTAGTAPAFAQPVPDTSFEFLGDVPAEMWRWMQEIGENGGMLPALPGLPDNAGPQRPAEPPPFEMDVREGPSFGMGAHGAMPALGMAMRRGMAIGRIEAHLQTLAVLAFGARMADRDRDHRLSEAEFMEAAAGVFRMLDVNRDRSLDLGDAAVAMELFGAGGGGHHGGPGVYQFDDWSDHQMPGVYHFDEMSEHHGPGMHPNDHAGIDGPNVRYTSELDSPGMQFTERHLHSGPAGLDRGVPPFHIRIAPFAPGFWGDDNGQMPFDGNHRHIQKTGHYADPAPRDMGRGP